MANILNVENLSKSVGDSLLWQNVTFGMDEGDKVGVVARNGIGKSTLLAILAGADSADSGKIVYRGNTRIGYLPQEPHFDSSATVMEAAMQGVAADSRDKLVRLLTMMGISDVTAPASTLSGGQRKRLAIARTIISEPDFLILDEPTNHLDISTIEWLENYLGRSRATLLMVTHDRYFLDRVCNRIIEIDNHTIYTVDGNYAEYLRRRAERIEAMETDVLRARNTLRREQDWMNRQPQARGGKAKYRIDAYHELRERARGTAAQKDVALEVTSSRIGSKIFEARGVTKCFGDKCVLRDFSYTFARGEKIGIVGPNGVGKSTFIKMLMGLVAADAGTWDIGTTVRFGYYSQDGIDFDPRKKVVDAVTEIAEDIDLGDGRRVAPMQYLQKFLFSPADQQKYIARLSGGERCRLHLATVLMRQPNFLILDEPTNDLDIVTLGIVEQYLADFKGCAIVISHDRYFLDNIVDHLFVFEGDGIVRDFPGNYSGYREWLAANARPATEQKSEPAKPRRKDERPPKMTFKERREFEALGAEIEALNAEKSQIEEFFNSGATEGYAEKSQRYSAVCDELDAKEMRWLELSEKE